MEQQELRIKTLLKSLLLVTLFVTVSPAFSQSTFIINNLPEYTPEEDIIYVAGDFTAWQPGDPNYAFEKNSNNKWEITLQFDVGTSIQFKFTRGSWETVEKGAQGEEIANRTHTFTQGSDTAYFNVLNWADEGGGGGGSTAADNVYIVDDNFYMPELDRHRRVWIYLPPGYDAGAQNYPVLYMHDGQNLFDSQTSYSGEWEIDESLNELAGEGISVPIVVGVDNGGTERLNEYSPWINPSYGGGQGEDYVRFLVVTLKPYIDMNYRTLTDRNNTAIMGSSMGGYISHYAAMEYPDIFSKSGIFSPAYWFSDSILNHTTETVKQYPGKFYLLVGGEEGDHYVDQMWAMKDTLHSMGFTNDEVVGKETPGAQHNEYFWRNEFSDAYLWLFFDFANINNYNNAERVILVPNPVLDLIDISDIVDEFDNIKIVDISGKSDTLLFDNQSKLIDVSMLKIGAYILVIEAHNKTYVAKFIKK